MAESDCLEDELFEELEGVFKFPSHRISDICPDIDRCVRADDAHTPEGNVLFVPCNDTHVRMFLPIAKQLNDRHFLVIRGENADTYLSEHDEPFDHVDLKLFQGDKYKKAVRRILKRLGTTVVVFANDWVGENWRICEVCKEIGVPTVCIQEGPQDYELDDGKWRQMRYAEYVFAQGAITMQYLDTQRFYVSGNSRLSSYSPVALPEHDNIMINCNFTYNVYEDWRDRWIDDCVSACDGMNLPYFISQHPRDNGSFPNYNVIPSDAFKIIDQIHSANVLITRFSQVLYEAMLCGRQAIYYNPHGETKKVLTEDRSGAFFFAHDRDSLQEALREAIRREFRNTEERHEFLKLHCGPCDGKEVERILQGLAYLSQSKSSSAPAVVGAAEKEVRTIASNKTAKKLRSVIDEHGPYTAQNMELASGVFTLDEKTNYDHFKINRIKQLVADNGYLTRGTRLMDIASLQSMFAIEFATEGLDVISIEGRADNLAKGRFAAECFNLDNIEFHQDDVNNIHPDKYGTCDVILCMGILYHIAKNKYLDFLKNVSLCCDDVLILDTFISLHDDEFLEEDGTRYLGSSWREFDDDTTEEDMVKSAHSSLNNATSFSMTKDCLVAYLSSLGFTTISEVHEPEQPDQPLDRLTLLCRKGTKCSLNVFPKFNFQRDFEQATDSRGTQSNNVVFWNLPRGNGKSASFTAIS